MGLEKALINGIPVLFNPTEYSLEKSNQFQDASLPGLPSPITQFVSGGAQTLSMELFFDTYTYENGKDVRTYTDAVTNLTKIDPGLLPLPSAFSSGGRSSSRRSSSGSAAALPCSSPTGPRSGRSST